MEERWWNVTVNATGLVFCWGAAVYAIADRVWFPPEAVAFVLVCGGLRCIRIKRK